MVPVLGERCGMNEEGDFEWSSKKRVGVHQVAKRIRVFLTRGAAQAGGVEA